jgi:hypothetical protein
MWLEMNGLGVGKIRPCHIRYQLASIFWMNSPVGMTDTGLDGMIRDRI